MRIVVPYSCPVDVVVNLETGLVEDVIFYPDRLGIDDGPHRDYGLRLSGRRPCRELRIEPLSPACPTLANLQTQEASPTYKDLRRATALAEEARLEQQLPDCHCE